MYARVCVGLLLCVLPGLTADWNPKLAAEYLDTRQEAWFAWPNSHNPANGVCLSCHTGLSYLLARPALRRAIRENEPTRFELGLLADVEKRLSRWPPASAEVKAKAQASDEAGVESVLSALLLASADARTGKLSAETEKAFDRLWALQLEAGPNKGAWNWENFDLDPYEEPASAFFGASLAAVAVGVAPSGYLADLQNEPNLAALRSYLLTNKGTQPLHNRLALAWASVKMKGLLSDTERKAWIEEAFRKQAPDGGWTVESLGTWSAHPKAPATTGSGAYATAFAAFTLQEAGVSRNDRNLKRALDWLRSHQNLKAGYWDAPSMNKPYPAGSMQSQFMRDAATAYAALALVGDNP